MRELTQSELLQVNGGATYYYCRVCGYTSYKYMDVYLHALIKEVIPTAVGIKMLLG